MNRDKDINGLQDDGEESFDLPEEPLVKPGETDSSDDFPTDYPFDDEPDDDEAPGPSQEIPLPPRPEFASTGGSPLSEGNALDDDPEDPDGEEPPTYEDAKCETPAAVFFSDFHMSDGGIGDDYMDKHLKKQKAGPGAGAPVILVGNPQSGPSRVAIFNRVMPFVIQFLKKEGVTDYDVVLNGDIVDLLEMSGRGTKLSALHHPFWQICQALRQRGARIFYLRGNHDFIIPPGPWTPAATYANSALTTFAEHGDAYDPNNWPPGFTNTGSQLVLNITSWAEVHPTALTKTTLSYLLAGIDNLRPFSGAAFQAFFQRRNKIGKLAKFINWLLTLPPLKTFIGQADDTANKNGALAKRAKQPYLNWLMVQGHTHVPAVMPGQYYNTASWLQTLLCPAADEVSLDVFPFLIVWLKGGVRQEAYFTVNFPAIGPPKVLRRDKNGINNLRQALGYPRF